MYSFIRGFQRLVWCPKWTPASSNSFMVMLANQPPCLVCILHAPAGPLRIAIPVPAPRGTRRIEHPKPAISFQLLASSQIQRPCHSERSEVSRFARTRCSVLSLRILEPFTRALLSVLLAFFGARVAAYHAFRLQ